MKARHIKKLRKRIATFDEYEVASSCNLFGEPYGVDYIGKSIKADKPVVALYRYWRKYHRMHKEIHPFSGCDYGLDVSAKWGKFRVTNKRTRYKFYFR